MDPSKLVDIIQNVGVAVAMLGYFVWRDYSVMRELRDTMAVIRDKFEVDSNGE